MSAEFIVFMIVMIVIGVGAVWNNWIRPHESDWVHAVNRYNEAEAEYMLKRLRELDGQ